MIAYSESQKPVVVYCDDYIESLHNFRRDIQKTYGDNVEIIVATGYYNFCTQMQRLIKSGNFPDFLSIDRGLGPDLYNMILFMARIYSKAKRENGLNKSWPKNILIHSFAFDIFANASDYDALRESLPDEVKNQFEINLSRYRTAETAINALSKLYEDIPQVPEDYITQDTPIIKTNGDSSVIRSHLEYFYKEFEPALCAQEPESRGLTCKSGFGSIVSGYIAYTKKDIERIEEERNSVRSIDGQDTILVVKSFDERRHGPLLPRIRGIIICNDEFEPHIQVSLQNFGISALIGGSFQQIKKKYPATNSTDYGGYYGSNPTKVYITPSLHTIFGGSYQEKTQRSQMTTDRQISEIESHLSKTPLLPGIKIQADHYTQSRSLFASLTSGIGLIRSESLIRGDAKHYDTAVAVLSSIGECDLVLEWQKVQEEALRVIIKAHKYDTPVCFRLADFGSGDFLPKEHVKIIQNQLDNDTVILPQGVQLARVKPHIYKGQLRAAFKVAHDYKIKDFEILIPQVETADDVQFIRDIATEVLAEEGQVAPTTYKIGSMIETNSAIANIEAISVVSDFMSIGMNDLIRVNQNVPRLWHLRQENKKTHSYDPYIQPPSPILQKVSEAVNKVKDHDIRLCGEFAGTVDGFLFAHRNGIKCVVVTPNEECTDLNPLIAKEILWRESQKPKPIQKSDDPIASFQSEIKRLLEIDLF